MKLLLSRKFCQINVRENFRNFYIVAQILLQITKRIAFFREINLRMKGITKIMNFFFVKSNTERSMPYTCTDSIFSWNCFWYIYGIYVMVAFLREIENSVSVRCLLIYSKSENHNFSRYLSSFALKLIKLIPYNLRYLIIIAFFWQKKK